MTTARRLLALLAVLLIVSLPITYATELKLQYDANGNLLTGDGKYRVYNSLNQLASVYNGTNASGTLLESFTYHPTEERILVKKAYYTNGTANVTTIYLSSTFVRLINASGTYDSTYVSHDGQLVAQSTNGTVIYIHSNHEGSSTVITGNSTSAVAGTLPQLIFNHTFCTTDQGYTGYGARDTVQCALNMSTSSGNIFGPNQSYESNYTQAQADFNITFTFKYSGGNNNKFYPTVICSGLGSTTNKFNFESQNGTHFHIKADRGGFSATTNFAYNTTQTALFETNFTTNKSRACIGSSCTNWENFTRDANLEDCFAMSFSNVSGGAFQILNVSGTQNLKPYNVSGGSVTILENTTYTPFGEVLTGGTQTRYGYEGKEADTLVGDTDFGFRKYKPEWGMFTQPDPVLPNVYDPQQLNRYSFERNSPYKYKDPDGHFLQLLIPGVIGGIINTINYYASHDNPTTEGAAGYFTSGFVQGSAMLGGEGAVIGGAVAGRAIERYADGMPLTGSEANTDYAGAAIAAALTYGVANFLPPARTWLIKTPGAFVTTGTGQRFIVNQLVENGASQFFSHIWDNLVHNAQQTTNTAVTKSTHTGGGSGGSTIGHLEHLANGHNVIIIVAPVSGNGGPNGGSGSSNGGSGNGGTGGHSDGQIPHWCSLCH